MNRRDLFYITSVKKSEESRPKFEESKTKLDEDIASEPIAVFFRTRSMMAIYPAKNRVLFKFMNASNDGTYDKESRSYLMLNREELFRLVVALEKDLSTPVDIFHTYNGDAKSLKIGRGKRDPATIFAYFTHNGRSYVIRFDEIEFKYFKTILRMLLYEMYTGTRVGFTYNWV